MTKLRSYICCALLLAAFAVPAWAQVTIQGQTISKDALREIITEGAAMKTVVAKNSLAKQNLTFTGQPANTETVTVGGKTYTYQTTLTNVANNVAIGATTSASITNLVSAINAESSASGTGFAAATTINANVTGTKASATVLTAIAKVAGVAGNSIASTKTVTNASWGAATLAGGVSYPLDTNNYSSFRLDATANTTVDIVGHSAGRIFTLIVKQDATGSRLITWDTEVIWPAGTAPTLTTTASKSDTFRFLDTGVKYIGQTGALNYTE